MKRIVTLSLIGALTLGMLATGVAAAHQNGGGGHWQGGDTEVHSQWQGGNKEAGQSKHGELGLKGWTACTLTAAVSGTSVYAKGTSGKPGGTINVEVKVKHPDTTVTTYSGQVIPTFPTAGAGAAVTLTRNGTSFVLKGPVPVPSTATAGNATLAVSGSYGTSTFTCNVTAAIKVPKPKPAPVCTSTVTGLQVWAWATPAMPGGTLWVAVMVKKPDASATITASATATIPPAAATASKPLTPLGKWAVLAASFPVDPGATLGGTATVNVSGTSTVASVATTFTCSLSTPIKNVEFWSSKKGH
jgi:hypothetical protein